MRCLEIENISMYDMRCLSQTRKRDLILFQRSFLSFLITEASNSIHMTHHL